MSLAEFRAQRLPQQDHGCAIAARSAHQRQPLVDVARPGAAQVTAARDDQTVTTVDQRVKSGGSAADPMVARQALQPFFTLRLVDTRLKAQTGIRRHAIGCVRERRIFGHGTDLGLRTDLSKQLDVGLEHGLVTHMKVLLGTDITDHQPPPNRRGHLHDVIGLHASLCGRKSSRP